MVASSPPTAPSAAPSATRPPRQRLLLAWDLFMLVLAVVNVALILFDYTYPWLRPAWLAAAPGLVDWYDPRRERFWLIDLPFLLVFAGEFFLRWAVAARRRTYVRWYIYPFVHWYDLLGIVPAQELRFFRLFRVISVYMRLRRSDVVSMEDDVVARLVRRFSDVISEEVTDRVALRILDLVKQEIEAGALSQITRAALLPRRDEVRRHLVARLVELLADPDLHERAGSFLRVNLDRAVGSSPALRRIPLPDAVLAPLVRATGEVVYDSIVETLTASLRSPDGRQALEDLVDEVMEIFSDELGRGEIEHLVEQTVLDLVDEMKRAVAVRRWPGPEV
jgi:hypothetical protein